ncbi:MAG: glutamate--cysteine ligase [Candidatus Poseidoniaceae archaeon]|nr:glutamate--cysteine ligase [Candidatus Poseidoniaceae archaeon]
MNYVHEYSEILESKREQITAWMTKKRSEVPIPIYGSVDVRDAGWKVAVVDANHFPAGFNNVSKEDEPHLAALLKNHILRIKGECKWVHLYPESHTRNAGYIENVATIQRLLILSGFRCTVGSPELSAHGSLAGISGPLQLSRVELKLENGIEELFVEGKRPCLILLNNDLTEGIVPGLSANNVSPPPSMGWHRRRKSEHYICLQKYVDEMAQLLEIDSWHLMANWFVSENKCLDEETCRVALAKEVDEFIENIRAKYESLGIEREPVVFVKNDRGTYGLGIMAVKEGKELLELSNRKMKKLMYSKGGADVENFLIQEGVPTLLTEKGGAPVEPVVYLVDGEAASWFYRINDKKGDMDNLNSPNAEFFDSSEVGHLYGEHAKGWHALVAELSMLAMGSEAIKYANESSIQ